MKSAGIAINCMTIPNIRKAEDIEGIVFELTDKMDDSENELAESVIWEPGQSLELKKLKIAFGKIKNKSMNIKLNATCFKFNQDSWDIEENKIAIKGDFLASAKVNHRIF